MTIHKKHSPVRKAAKAMKRAVKKEVSKAKRDVGSLLSAPAKAARSRRASAAKKDARRSMTPRATSIGPKRTVKITRKKK